MAVRKVKKSSQMSFAFAEDSQGKTKRTKKCLEEEDSREGFVKKNFRQDCEEKSRREEDCQKKPGRPVRYETSSSHAQGGHRRIHGRQTAGYQCQRVFCQEQAPSGFRQSAKGPAYRGQGGGGQLTGRLRGGPLDACEEAHILPSLRITIKAVENADNKYILNVTDNGPGIVKSQVPNIFARLLYGSKFHTLKMSRGQQGIGISAAGMYGLLTTGEPVQIITRTNPKKPAQHYHVQIDTTRNRPDVVKDEECDFDLPRGTSVTITLEGRYQKGKQSVDEYIAQTAMANPHATIIYNAPDGSTHEYKATTRELPFIPVEIKPHPYGVEIGILFKMARDSSSKTLVEFLRKEFSRVSPRLAAQIAKTAGLSSRMWIRKITLKQVEALHKAINETKIMAPSSDCIGPIGQQNLEDGLRRVVDAEFYTYGFRNEDNGRKSDDDDREPLMRLSRIANRVPLLYQQSGCAIYKAVLETNWRSYGLSQSKGALPRGPVMLMVHIASVWVPFTSESKEAIAHYPEIIKEIKLAVRECGRKLGIHVRRQRRIRDEMVKRSYIETYLPPIGEALRDILDLKDGQVATVVGRLKETLERSRKL